MKQRANLYIRVSTDEQAHSGYSQRSQDEFLTKYCEINGIDIVNRYFEDHSAKNFERPEFRKLLLLLHKQKGSVDLLLFTKWDRFSRNAGDAYGMIARLNRLGVTPQAIEQPLDLEVPENKMMLAFYLAAPEVENHRRALNIMYGLRRAMKEGRFITKAPIGYLNKITESGRKYIHPGPMAPLVKWIFETIATEKITTEAVWKLAKERGLKLEKNPFWNLVRNPVYAGFIKVPAYKDEAEQLVKGTHEPIISSVLFNEVQDILNGRRRAPRTNFVKDDKFPLRGLLLCPICQRSMTASSSRGRKLYYDYYHCRLGCSTRYPANDVNDAIAKELATWRINKAVKPLFDMILKDVHEQENKSFKQEMHMLKAELKLLLDQQIKARELVMEGTFDKNDYLAVKNLRDQRILAVECRLAEMQVDCYVPDFDKTFEVLEQLDQLYVNSDSAGKKNIVGSIFPEKLYFDGNRFRTTRVNEAVSLISSVAKVLRKNETGQNSNLTDLSRQVELVGIL